MSADIEGKARRSLARLYSIMKKVSVFALLGWALAALLPTGPVHAAPVVLNFNGTGLYVVGEYINSVPVATPEFAPLFAGLQTVHVSIGFDDTQVDANPSADTGTFQFGSLSIQIPELSLSASRSNVAMQISLFDNNSGDDQFFAYTAGASSFANGVSLPAPIAFSALIFSPVSTFTSDTIPTSPFNWTVGNVSLDFSGSDLQSHQVLMAFTPIPEVSTFALWAGMAALPICVLLRRRHVRTARRS
jgi:hypothetical protein